MSIFNWGKTAEGVGNGVATASESIRFALTGDMPPEERVKLEELYLKAKELEAGLKEKRIDLTIVDAKSPSLFKSGWRPFLGWVSVTGFSLVFVIFPIFEWLLNIYVVFNDIELTKDEAMALKPPSIDAILLLNLLGALLGIGTLRTIEKGKGITK